ncbi:DUF5305 family protein [Halodesulfurarchaeum sp.]|uniref:DUF5305 family protein n=1 Tax=Halodesulfurarchaeum sp. TaxID=1980530 RepID=UPI002FC2DC64
MERETALHARSFLASWGWVLAVLLFIGVLIGGWATYTSVIHPGTTEEVEETDVWSIDTTFTHEATVFVENPVYENGTTLEDRSTYFTALSPRFNGTYTATYQSQTDEPLSLEIQRLLVITAQDEDQIYWTNTTSAGSSVKKTLDPGETVIASVSVNATKFDQRRNDIVDAIGSSPGETTLSLVFDVTAEGVVDGNPTEVSFSDQVPIAVASDSYTIEQGIGSEETITRETVTAVPSEYGPLMQVGGPLLVLVSLLILGVLGYAWWEDGFELTDTEQEYLEYHENRSEFDEWIVKTTVPDALTNQETSEAETLTDLVDFAIDSDVAALEDPETKAVYAVAPEVTITYHPPPAVDSREESAKDFFLGLFQEG